MWKSKFASKAVNSQSFGGAKWADASITAKYAIYYKKNGAPEDDNLIGCIDFGGDVTCSNDAFKLQPSKLKLGG